MTDPFIKKLQQGDALAYEELYKNHYKILCLVANEYVHDPYIAESIVSDVIFSLWENRTSLHIEQLRAYLVRSVRNSSLNYIEHQYRQERLKKSFAHILNEKQTSYKELKEYPLCELLEKELDAKIKASIATLPAQTRTIFLLSRYEELSYDEIAQKTHTTIHTVKYHIRLALNRLRDDLQDYLLALLLLLSFF